MISRVSCLRSDGFRAAICGGLLAMGVIGFAQTRSTLVEKDFPFVDPMERMGKFDYAKNHLVVSFMPGVSDSAKVALAQQIGLKVSVEDSGNYFVVVEIPERAKRSGMTVESAVRYFNQMPSVRYAEFDVAIEPDFMPNDPSFGNLYGLHNTGQSSGKVDADMDVPEAWDVTGVGNPVVIAVCDDGVDWGHPDLAANIWSNTDEIAANGIDDDGNGFIDDTRGWDFSAGDNNPAPGGSDSHGTHVAGTVGAVNNNGIGITGAGRNNKIMPLRMYGTGSSAWMSHLANAVDYAWQNGAEVISVSYNIDGFTNALVEAIQRADAADVIYCNSAGNNNQLNPARAAIRDLASNVIFVAASDRNDNRASFSNYGVKIEIFAAGVDVYSTLPGNTYGNNSGTSMATPNVASVLGVMRAHLPALTDRQILDRLIGTADSVASLASFVPGGKRANLNGALETDLVPPSAVTGLAVLRRAQTVAEIEFRTSGDDGMTGAADGYDVRVSSSMITEANFATAQPVSVSVPNLPAGQLVRAQPRGMWPGGSIYMAVRARDNMGNNSPISVLGPFNLKSSTWSDRVEGAAQFSSSDGWATTTEKAFSSSRSWTDSPGGNYGNNANRILTQNSAVTVGGLVGVNFWADLDLESNADFLVLEYSINGGAWTLANRWSGLGSWANYSAVIPSAANDSVRIRFRMTSNASVVRNGVYLDDIAIVGLSEVMRDTVEGAVNFNATSPWARTTASFVSPTQSWTDSPAGNYGDNLNISLTGNTNYSTAGIAGANLTFQTRYDLETNYDYLYTEVSTDSGNTWTSLGRLNGLQAAFAAQSFALPGADSVRFRFRLTTDGSVVRDGVYIDDIVISGEPWENLRMASFTLRLERWRGLVSNQVLGVEILQPGTNTMMEQMTVPAQTGFIRSEVVMRFAAPAQGIADVRFTLPGYLKRRAQNVNLASVQPGDFLMTMIAGDADGDNDVDANDVTYIQARIGAVPGDPNYVRSADIDGNNLINFWDIQATLPNIGLVGQ
jgi:subtilisin family serine protease